MRRPTFLPDIVVEPLVRSALLEDLGRAGDVTTAAVVPWDLVAEACLVARQSGIVAGLGVAALAFRLIDPNIKVTAMLPDGSWVVEGDIIASVNGPAHGLLAAERVALNFLCHMSGIATETAAVVSAIKAYPARLTCTRKTTPGLRALEKYAIRVGGGLNHRFGLDDAVLIKDNHIVLAGGVRPAIERARSSVSHMMKIAIEVDTVEQLAQALTLGVDSVLLDNMGTAVLEEAVRLARGRAITEASGRITRTSAPKVAATGVDYMSMGWLTHSAPVLDIGLDIADDGLSRCYAQTNPERDMCKP
ncbi:carboxylating nicotinate-nucleotide diphosphorylase [Mesorhizobium muleiense]|uniref:carboxylating nicotinate-nucleotide diphosphorylase n=1 Tax=Mesorhizobium muleiense TaxID=1004279 RepID=UPI001F2F9442|nr:carboxylating nicotinate-nucleotide diphosphorylase [Mesorhizobium muleiense]MCF6108429.1 carboxylating nicotinate-nucleotide diphosphorylase [Mesorhizobium muleiense]